MWEMRLHSGLPILPCGNRSDNLTDLGHYPIRREIVGWWDKELDHNPIVELNH
jgi:hypothetical protein